MIAAIVRGVGVALPFGAALKLAANCFVCSFGSALAYRVSLLAGRVLVGVVLQVEGAI